MGSEKKSLGVWLRVEVDEGEGMNVERGSNAMNNKEDRLVTFAAPPY